MRFKLVIKRCTKLDFDLAQKSTGPCSLTRHPPCRPIVALTSCLLSKAVRQAVTSCCLSGCLPPGQLGKPWKSNSFSFPAFLATSEFGVRQEWSGGGLWPQLGLLVGHGKATLKHSWLPERFPDKAWNGRGEPTLLPCP